MSIYISTITISDDYLVVQNEGSHTYTDFSMSVQHLQHLVFKVKACHSVYVLLGATFNNDHKVDKFIPKSYNYIRSYLDISTIGIQFGF